MKSYLPFLFLTCLFSCGNPQADATLADLQAENQDLTEQLQALQSAITQEGPLEHLVFFKLQPNADQELLVAEIKKLTQIPQVLDLEVGPFEDLSDARAMSDYGLLMTMSFADTTAYKIYQQHPIHLALREMVQPHLAGPPLTYDFIKQ